MTSGKTDEKDGVILAGKESTPTRLARNTNVDFVCLLFLKEKKTTLREERETDRDLFTCQACTEPCQKCTESDDPCHCEKLK